MRKCLLWALFGMILGLMILRCFYTVNYSDEVYAISSVWRYYKGDALLAEDWYPAQQLLAWILVPFYSLFYWINGSNTGIVLWSRLLFVVVSGICTLYLYRRLIFYQWAGLAATAFFFFSVPYNIQVLNYNTIGCMALTLLLVMLLTEDKERKYMYFICGIIFAVVVLCIPYTLVLYIIWGIACLIKKDKSGSLRPLNYIYAAFGAGFVFILFLIAVFSRCRLYQITDCMRYILGNPDYQGNMGTKCIKYFIHAFQYYKFSLASILVAGIVRLWEKKTKYQWLKPTALCVTFLAVLIDVIYYGCFVDFAGYNLMIMAPAYGGIAVFILFGRHKKIFYGWLVPAFFYTFCVQLSSDTGILAVAAASMSASAAGILLLSDTVFCMDRGSWKGKAILALKCIKMAGYFFIVVLLAITLYNRLLYVWWDSPVRECNVRLYGGPMNGIYTNPDGKEWYEQILEQMDLLKMTKSDKLLVVGTQPWIYLYADVEPATYSTWGIDPDHSFLEPYYQYYPDKEPTVIFCVDYTMQDVFDSRILKEYVDKNYDVIEMDGVTALKQKKKGEGK